MPSNATSATDGTSVDLQPRLRGELVELHPLKSEDWTELYTVASDPLIWEQHPASDRWKESVFAEFFRGGLASASAFAIIEKATGRIIGSTRFHGHDSVAREVEIGWTFLARRFWGGKYNGEVKRLMLDHAFTFVDRVIFLVGPANVRSQRALQKIGAVRTGLSAQTSVAAKPSVKFSIEKANWKGS